jgi:alkylation response protein AidB-like acyl-CoA dehydrogenase
MPLATDERAELRTTARDLFTQRSPLTRVRSVVSEPPGFDRDLWEQMVALGWNAIHVAEQHGGAGSGYADLAVILHELGRAITPSPFFASAVLATGALSLASNEPLAAELLPPLASGLSVGSMAFASSEGSYELSRLTTAWRSRRASMALQGTSGFVLDADTASVLIVAARDEAGVVAVVAVETDASGLHIERVPTVDGTRRLFKVSFDDVAVGRERLLCEPGAQTEELLMAVLSLGVIGAACDATGVADQALQRAAEYAKQRTQFGKPIGTFQAVKHSCADMAIAVEASRAATGAAAEALDGDRAGWNVTASITSSYVGPACSEACGLGLRVHGGIGFTWEHDSHLYLKRAKLDEVLFGTPSWHRRRLAEIVFPSLVAS